MASSNKREKSPFAWFQALCLNLLFCVFAVAFGKLVVENRKALGEEFVNSSDAVIATQTAVSKAFSDLVPAGVNQRQFWADEIEKHIREGDVIVSRGLLLAAPDMLNRKDSGAILAAANTDRAGSEEERRLAAATLFLPDDVRARYERAISPSDIETLARNTPSETEPVLDENLTTEDELPLVDQEPPPETSTSPTRSFSVLGNERDLAFQAAGWLRGDKTDVTALRLSGLGLAVQSDRLQNVRDAASVIEGASLMKSARRAGRLQSSFEKMFERRLDEALSEEDLKNALTEAFGGSASLFIQSDAILDAFVLSINTQEIGPVFSDLRRIALLSDGRPQASTLTLLEAVKNQRDLKRAELLTFAAGDRAVALTEYYGNDALSSARTVLDWTMNLILMIAGVVFLLVLMLFLALSTLGQSFKDKSRLPASSYRY